MSQLGNCGLFTIINKTDWVMSQLGNWAYLISLQ